MKYKSIIAAVVTTLFLSGCTDWIYRIDVPQGNFLQEKSVKQLRVEMTKEQVIYVLGRPVVQDSFDHDTWYYIYEMKRGMSKRGEDFRKELIIHFEDEKVASVTGDFELSEDFNTPLDQ
ncbi:outer membrane protein assembly factor BamE [Aliiglaciecola sp. 2_MG-2023]|uniref:outer membrane protein assembly factor BamE n=1 Tax=Alteromonadaceae TaxID=72275 RepID=UPI0026E30A86|nr:MULTISPECIES: outer membrane protein assembly factor BamE [unclassified Aliiglaciecola]MDO6711639.1 outer membrane protein assembly factor BamE [Aliiglaciecola sp. 2_MG-2023]MDO6752710.1 outer membrane protein assembly factor BamE [Aliiglaciecola sp. 1_MG-2023]